MMKRDESPIIVRTEGVSKTYRLSNRNRVEALKDLTISISRGKFVLIEGPSGSGKTTLLNLLGCLDFPSKGRLFFHEEEVTDFNESSLCRIRRDKIGFVFQQFHLLLRMTAWENVSIGLIPLGVSEKERFTRAKTLLEQLGLNERIHHRPEELSGGEQQRVSFARALIQEPELILADEPTSNIDADSAERVLQILTELKSRGCTIVVASHDAETFQRAGVDAQFRLAKGRIEN